MEQKILSKLQKVLEFKQAIEDIHPLLEKVFPIAIVEDEQFFVYDLKQSGSEYEFIKSLPVPMPVPDKVRASFPLAGYNNQPVCIVTQDIFDESGGYATIFHEFIHCQQAEICEQSLKDRLSIARKAQQAGDFMWEINHPFPYQDQKFVELYLAFLESDDFREVKEIRAQLYKVLPLEDYEYMVWQEWKEGLARYIENKIRQKLTLQENKGGRSYPLDRVVLYSGGEHYIHILNHEIPGAVNNIESLFGHMFRKD